MPVPEPELESGPWKLAKGKAGSFAAVILVAATGAGSVLKSHLSLQEGQRELAGRVEQGLAQVSAGQTRLELKLAALEGAGTPQVVRELDARFRELDERQRKTEQLVAELHALVHDKR